MFQPIHPAQLTLLLQFNEMKLPIYLQLTSTIFLISQ